MTAIPEGSPGWSSGPAERPYAAAADSYWRAGWRGVLPLPPRRKASPPPGYTGHGAPYLSFADLFSLVEGPEGAGNICLRMPDGVLGLDVDAYDGKPGAATLAGLEVEHGPLPATWISTSRTDGVSGIRLFRVPEGVNWLGALPGIETIHAGHRYLVAAPSVHPEGRPYRWLAPDGTDAGRVPAPGELPQLPLTWVAALARPYPRTDPADLDDGQAAAWLRQVRQGAQCRPVTAVLVRELTRMAARDGGARHDICRDASRSLAAFGGEGHAGVREALDALGGGFIKAVTDPAHPGTTRDAGAAKTEWRELLLGAVRLAAAANPVPGECDCVDDQDLYDLIGQPRPATASEPAGNAGSGERPPAREPARPEPARIDITDEPGAIRSITRAVCSGAIPETYVRDGRPVRVGAVSGSLADQHTGPQVGIETINADGLRRLLAHHTVTYRVKSTKTAAYDVPASPAVATCKAVLSATDWPGVRPLVGVVATPVLRPDGTLIQQPGYDEPTALYYHPDIEIAAIPAQPDGVMVEQARRLLLDYVLVDFPFATDADRANYIALLMAPILQPYLDCLSPLGAISATERGSGKTLLTTIMGRLFGAVSRPWVSADEELRKAITTVLVGGSEPVVVFDNVGEHDQVAAPSLAKLLTSRRWDDRKLGTNVEAKGTNNRLWLVTGNSIEFGGDIAQRTVLVRLDAKCPRPDLRTDFHIPDLEAWLDESDNRVTLLRALLILARDWTAAGGRREEFVMRGFARWVCGMGGFLAHHGISGFLANSGELEEHDHDAQQWAAFLAAWHARFGATPKTAYELRDSADQGVLGFGDPWGGAFITRADTSTLPTARGLGMMLARRRGRYFGDYVLNGVLDEHTKTWSWFVTPARARVP